MKKSLIVIVLVFSIISLLSFYRLSKTNFYSWGQYNIAIQNYRAANIKREYDVISAGDSTVMYSINPRVLSKTLKIHSAYNFAFPSNTYTNYYLEFLSKRMHSRSLIILGITAQSLSSFSMNDSLKRLRKDKSSLYLPLMELKLFFKNIIPHINLKNSHEIHNFYSLQFKQRPLTQVVDGHTMMQCNSLDDKSVVESYKSSFRTYKFDERYLKTLGDYIKKWIARGIRVFYYFPPRSQAVSVVENNYRLSGFSKNKVKKDLKFFGAIELTYDDNDESFKTCDGDHLHSEEAKKFSNVIANKINTIIND